MYIDQDGDRILESIPEIQNFVQETKCSYCREEAQDMLGFVTSGKADVKQIVFTMECSHLRIN